MAVDQTNQRDAAEVHIAQVHSVMLCQCKLSLCFDYLNLFAVAYSCYFSAWPGLGIHFVPEKVGLLDKLPYCSLACLLSQRALCTLSASSRKCFGKFQAACFSIMMCCCCSWNFQIELQSLLTSMFFQFASHFQIPQVRLWMKPDFKLLEETQQELIDIQDQDYPVTYCEACIEKKFL